MNPLPEDNIFKQTWPLIKQLAEKEGYSLVRAQMVVCKIYKIPRSKVVGFQFVPEYIQWRNDHLKQKIQDKRWIKC